MQQVYSILQPTSISQNCIYKRRLGLRSSKRLMLGSRGDLSGFGFLFGLLLGWTWLKRVNAWAGVVVSWSEGGGTNRMYPEVKLHWLFPWLVFLLPFYLTSSKKGVFRKIPIYHWGISSFAFEVEIEIYPWNDEMMISQMEANTNTYNDIPPSEPYINKLVATNSYQIDYKLISNQQ